MNPFKWNSDDWKDAGANLISGGLLGYGENGLEAGAGIKLASKGVAEVTGVAAMTRQMEEEMKRAEARAAEERANLANLREEEIMAAQNADLAASARAASSRSLATNTSNFLGL